MKHKRFCSILFLAGAAIALNAGPTWSQTTPSAKPQSEVKESQGQQTKEDKTEPRTQDSRMSDRKKGDIEMEARGAQKPGRMETPEAHIPEAKNNPGEKWTKEDIQKAQEALKSKGHDPGSIDGTMGPKTRQAISAFQKASGLKETGSLDAETANKLGIQKPTRSETSSQPSTSSTESKATTSPMQKERSSPMHK
jgi:hypothetical protein